MPEVNPETMPLEELLALANAEAPQTEEVFEGVAQPRNADGTFAAVVPAVVEPIAVVAAVPPTEFSRTVDLGDGSGSQVYKGASMDEVADKLVEAQKHATKKIRELNQIAKVAPVIPVKKELTPDEEYLLGQRMISEPSKAIREAIAAEFGMSADEVKKSIAAARQISNERVETAQSIAWITKHPEFYNNDSNGNKVRHYISRFCEGGMTQENLDAAVASLTADGLLQSKPAEVEPVVVVAPIVAPVRARASGLSSKISAMAPITDERFPYGDPSKMTIAQIAEAAAQQAREGK